MFYLDSPAISFRAKGILASALHAFPDKKCTAKEFKERHDDPHENAEYVFKFTLHELIREGFIQKEGDTFFLYEQAIIPILPEVPTET